MERGVVRILLDKSCLQKGTFLDPFLRKTLSRTGNIFTVPYTFFLLGSFGSEYFAFKTELLHSSWLDLILFDCNQHSH